MAWPVASVSEGCFPALLTVFDGLATTLKEYACFGLLDGPGLDCSCRGVSFPFLKLSINGLALQYFRLVWTANA